MSEPFDARRGCQPIWTGALGAALLFSLYWGYALYASYALDNGGPPVAVLFSGLPAWFRFRRVSRDFFDIAAMVVVTFQFMASWELRWRWSAPTRAALALAAAWGVRLAWVSPPDILDVLGYRATGMELSLLSLALAFAAIGSVSYAAELLLPVRVPREPKSSLGPVGWGRALRSGALRWLAVLAVFTAAVLIYNGHQYYVGLPRNSNPYFENWRMTVTLLWIAFAVLGLPYAVWTVKARKDPREEFMDPGLILLLVYRSLWCGLSLRATRPLLRLGNRRVRSALLDLVVKAFFLPIMITFLYIEAGGFTHNLRQLIAGSAGEGWGLVADIVRQALSALAHPGGAEEAQRAFWFLCRWLRSSIFVMDVSLGVLGYACSFWWLRNKTKSVDPTLSGWLVALMCYPPFSRVSDLYLPYTRFEGVPWAFFQGAGIRNVLLLAMVVLYGIYVWATMAFGLRFSNLTHRGIVTRGPYAWVRHPAYISKNLAWWAESVVRFNSIQQMAYLSGWNLVYLARAITEERHLRGDPDYQEYCRLVKYRLIPGVW